jgi:anti-sigma factor RsiW
MSPDRMYPRAIPTVRSRRSQALLLLRWLMLAALVLGMVAMAAGLIVHLMTIEAQLDSVFMQGMKAGYQICRGGV